MKLKGIMLIDDDFATNLYNEIVITQADLADKVVIFQNGMDALKYLKNSQNEIQLILLDINMPIMNGWQFLKSFNELQFSLIKRVIIVMLTSSIVSSEKERAFKYAGVKGFINKPLKLDLLKKIIAPYKIERL